MNKAKCPLCESDILGSAEAKYFCPNCRMFFEHYNIAERKKGFGKAINRENA